LTQLKGLGSSDPADLPLGISAHGVYLPAKKIDGEGNIA
jgi:hypothetical protein